ncbi:response regulator [Merismopedia glauca]|uniref:histidine kinase n=1 Tax=Merismopedia glauca CCAP 1448/3 TaxID=1296344 RepID=A0A2T1C1Z7_9CYAN|nr:response regulator [Merismopedia glauca]PSB02198.1 hypothetical protein C7B64_14300 [Merismopedia glauca CCAP 1448/3]
MVTIPESRAQTYHQFEPQAQALLQEIEQGLTALAEDRSLKTIYQLVRATHTLKVDAAYLNLELVHNLASGLESICRSLAQDTVNLEPQQWELLKSAYQYLKILLASDRLSVPETRGETELTSEIEILLTHLQSQIAALPPPPAFLPTSAELGIDVDEFILTQEVPQLLAAWEKIITDSKPTQLQEKLATQAEIFLRFGEVLDLTEFIDIAQVVLSVLANQPSLAIAVGKLALIGLKSAHQSAQQANSQIPEPDPEAISLESLFKPHQFSETPVQITPDDSDILDSASLSLIASKHNNSLAPSLAIEELIQDYVTEEELLPENNWQVADIFNEALVEEPELLNLELFESKLLGEFNPSTSSSVGGVSVTDASSLFTEPYFLDTETLLVWKVENLILTLPSSNILEISHSYSAYDLSSTAYPTLVTWKQQQLPLFHLGQLLTYSTFPPPKLAVTPFNNDTLPQPEAAFLIVVKLATETIAIDLVIDKLISQTYLEIQPFGSALLPPKYIYGCTLLEEDRLFPVVDVVKLLNQQMQQSAAVASSPTILIVDDSKTVREILRMTLQGAGYRVLIAENGEQALQYCHQHPEIKLTICDIEMPKVNGFEFLVYRRQQAEWRKIPVVMLTFCSTDREKNLAMQLGAAAYITKPYLKDDLLATIKGILACGNK